MKHKHSELIKQWADDASLVILVKSERESGEWGFLSDQLHPKWLESSSYFLVCKKHIEVALHWLSGGEVEVLGKSGGWTDFHKDKSPKFSERCSYRVKPKGLSIPWECINDKWQFATVDKDGAITLWIDEPYMIINHCNQWENDTGKYFEVNGILKVDATCIDWKESLVRRPQND